MKNNRIRVAILGTQGIPAKYGGYETFAEELATRLATNPIFEISIYCPRPDKKSPLLDHFKGVQLRYILAPFQGGLRNLLFDVFSILDCRDSYDVVYLLGYGAVWAMLLPRLLGCRVWVNLDGLEWRRAKWSPIIRGYLRFSEWLSGLVAHRIICDAKAIQAYYQRVHPKGAPSAYIAYGTTLPASVESSEVDIPFGLKSRGYFLLVARLEPENQVLEIIQGYLASSCSRPLVIVGDLDDRHYVRKIQALAGPKVIFVGGVYDRKLLTLLRGHAFGAFHGHSVGGTNPSLLEAIAAGRPIIAHDNPFNREVGGSLLSYFIRQEDIQALVEDLETEGLTRDLDQSRRASIWLTEHYNWDLITQQYAALIMADCEQI